MVKGMLTNSDPLDKCGYMRTLKYIKQKIQSPRRFHTASYPTQHINAYGHTEQITMHVPQEFGSTQ